MYLTVVGSKETNPKMDGKKIIYCKDIIPLVNMKHIFMCHQIDGKHIISIKCLHVALSLVYYSVAYSEIFFVVRRMGIY